MARRLAASLSRLPSHTRSNTSEPVAFNLRRTVKQSTASWHCRDPVLSSYCLRLVRLRSSAVNGRVVSLRPTYRSSVPSRHIRISSINAMVAASSSNRRNLHADFHSAGGSAWNNGMSLRLGLYERSSRSLSHRANVDGGKAQDDVAGDSTSSSSDFLTLPTVLTLVRVVAVPFIIPAFYHSPSAAAAIFIAASITDWLDGYLARMLKCSSPFGAFLDPVADKLMVAAVLVLLSTELPPAVIPSFNPLPLWAIALPSIAIIGREIAMSALREWAAIQSSQLSQVVAVSGYGKWKTATQLISIAALLLVRIPSIPAVISAPLATVGVCCLDVAAGLSVWSFAAYIRVIAKAVMQRT